MRLDHIDFKYITNQEVEDIIQEIKLTDDEYNYKETYIPKYEQLKLPFTDIII